MKKICVCGLWHLGSVTAACMAEHFQTVGYDPDGETVRALGGGTPPVFEPGLADLVKAGLSSGRLSFSSDPAGAVSGSDLVWIAMDTPVDENDRADEGPVERLVRSVFPFLGDGTLVLVSSQVGVGFTSRMEAAFRRACPGRRALFACSPENLRLGKALDSFRRPERVVAGLGPSGGREVLARAFAPFCERIEWMSVESAEMTKHALNAFLAASVVFINEVSSLCESCGADAKEVERGLTTDPRIGPRAYLKPGQAFAGGTLARDVGFLVGLGKRRRVPTRLFSAVRSANRCHSAWPRRKLSEMLGGLEGKTVAVWGLTYKPGTDTLRRSAALSLCRWAVRRGARVRAFDPGVRSLRVRGVELSGSAAEALRGADALWIATEHPEFKSVPAGEAIRAMRRPVVLDPGRFLAGTLGREAGVRYAAVGLALSSSPMQRLQKTKGTRKGK